MGADNANREFLCSFRFDNSTWSVSIWAATREEAEMKLRAAGKGKVDGECMGKIPAAMRCPTCGHELEGDDMADR